MVSTILANLEGCQERVLAGRLRLNSAPPNPIRPPKAPITAPLVKTTGFALLSFGAIDCPNPEFSVFNFARQYTRTAASIAERNVPGPSLQLFQIVW